MRPGSLRPQPLGVVADGDQQHAAVCGPTTSTEKYALKIAAGYEQPVAHHRAD